MSDDLAQEWVPDVLDGFEQLTLPLAADDEGEVAATLVRRKGASPGIGVDVLYLHGWVDYFHQAHLADFFENLGWTFYALDLRKYGRSLRDWQTPGYVTSLTTYDEDIEAALKAIGHPAPDAEQPTPENNSKPNPTQPEQTDPTRDPAISLRQPQDDAVLTLPNDQEAKAFISRKGLTRKERNSAVQPPAAPNPVAALQSPNPSIGENSAVQEIRQATDTSSVIPQQPPDTASVLLRPLERLAAIPPTGIAESRNPSQYPRKGPTKRTLVLMGHSTGGLIVTLWAAHHPGRADALILNSPWLEFQTGPIGRKALEGPIKAQALLAPMSPLVNVDPGFYIRSVSDRFEGEWPVNPEWHPDEGWRPRAAWLSAIFRGHERVAQGLDLDIPVLVLLSAKSAIPNRWKPELMNADQVLAVAEVAHRAPLLGQTVTTVRLNGALHDVTLSSAQVRTKLWTEMTRWIKAYVPVPIPPLPAPPIAKPASKQKPRWTLKRRR